MLESSPGHHLTAEDVAGFLDKRLSRRRLGQIEEHLDDCPECVEYLGAVVRSMRSPTSEEDAVGFATASRTAEELLTRLRPVIVASSPASGPGVRSWWTLRRMVPATAVVAGLVVILAVAFTYIVKPARARGLAARAMSELIELRQATGRVPLRYISGFQRARVFRSGFSTPDPMEDRIDAQLRRAVEMGPGELDTHLSLGLFLLDQGKLDEAEVELGRALEVDPASVGALNGLAVICYERAVATPSRALDYGRKGLALLRDAQEKDAEDTQVAFNLAMFYQFLGAAERAKSSWEAYLKRDPGSEWAQVALENLEALGR